MVFPPLSSMACIMMRDGESRAGWWRPPRGMAMKSRLVTAAVLLLRASFLPDTREETTVAGRALWAHTGVDETGATVGPSFIQSSSSSSLPLGESPLVELMSWTSSAENSGPHCYGVEKVPSNIHPRLCTYACLEVWKQRADTYAICPDKMKCFTAEFRKRRIITSNTDIWDTALAKKLASGCSFKTRSPDFPLGQFEIISELTVFGFGDTWGWESKDLCKDNRSLEVVHAQFAPPEVNRGLTLLGTNCLLSDITKETREACKGAIEDPAKSCSLREAFYRQFTKQYACTPFRTPTAGFFLNCPFNRSSKSSEECKLYRPAKTTVDRTNGSCYCPNKLTPCEADEAVLYPAVQEPRKAGQTIVAAYNRGFHSGLSTAWADPPCAATDVRVACKGVPSHDIDQDEETSTPAADQGPNCHRPTKESPNEFLCTYACKSLWDPEGEIANSRTPYDGFMKEWASNSFDILPKLSADTKSQLRSCSFERRNRYAPKAQYMHERWSSSTGDLEYSCPAGKKMVLVQALTGCLELLVKDVDTYSCQPKDVTKEVVKGCQTMLTTSKGTCLVALFTLLPDASECPLCSGAWGIVYRWDCVPESGVAVQCVVEPTNGAAGLENSTDSCACSTMAETCTLEEAEASPGWKSTVTLQTLVLLSGSLGFTSEGTENLYKISPTTDAQCKSSWMRALCKEPPAAKAPSPPVLDADCDNSFSTKTNATSFDDSICADECTRVKNTECKSEGNSWLCVAQRMTNCYVPNTKKITCKLVTEVGSYSESFRSCSCPGNEMPCTQEEVDVTEHEWKDSFGKGQALAVVSWQKCLWPDKTFRSDYGMASSPGCTGHRYKAVFCHATSTLSGASRHDQTADCETASTLDPNVFTEFQCKYGCGILSEKCRALVSLMPNIFSSEFACYSSLVGMNDSLRKCKADWKVTASAPGVGNLEDGFVVVTEKWTTVLFKKPISEPVVILSVPEGTNAVGVAQIRNVKSTGFEVRFKTDLCSVGFATPATVLGWLASSEGRFVVSGSGGYVRVGSYLVFGNKQATIRFFVSLKSSKPVVLLQIQDYPYDTDSEEKLPFPVVSATTTTQATIFLNSLRPIPSSQRVRIGYMVFDEIAGTHCTVGCRLNDVGLQTINKSVAGEWTEAKTETLVLSNPSYVFASVIGTDSFPLVALSRQTKSWFPGGPPANLPAGVAFLEKDSMRTGSAAAEQVAARSGDAMSQNGESTTASPKTRSSQQNTTGNGGTENSRTSSVFGNWYPVIDLIQDGDCAEGSLQRGTTFPSSPADVRLLYAKSVSATPPSQENRPVYRPDCQAARQKEGSSRDCVTECEELARACSAKGRDIWECFVESTPKEWKQKCTVMPTSATEALTTSTTAPPIDPAAACTIVDMQALEYQNMRGWDSKTDSCNCPHEIPACSPQQALFDSLTWSKLLGPEGSLCKSAGGTLKVVAHGFKLTQQNLCEKGFSTSQTSWEQIPFPPYAGEDLILGDNTIRGGYYRCTEEFRYVFCPGKLLYTTTTTAEPPWSWPADSDCVPTDWTEWSACSATCFSGSKGSKPAKTRKRFILVPKKGRGQDCVLLEQEPCERSSDFPACEEFCWQGNWSEWGACKLSTLKFGEDPLRTRTKIRYIFMDGGDVCPTESLIQHDTATCANTGSRTVPSVEATPSAPSEIDEPQPLPSPKPEHRETEEKGLAQPNEKSAAPGNGEGKENESSDRPDQGGTASGSLLQHSSETVESCDRLSAWSGCTAPCQPPAGDLGVKQYQLGLPRNVDTPISAYCATNTRDCSEKLQACKEDPTPDCSLVSGRYAAADETKQCRELCEIAVDACAKSAALIQQSQWECVAATLNDAGDGSCLYEREAVEDRVVRPPVCFLSRAQRADENTSLPFLHTDEATGAKSCKCATPATVPCSAEEVWRSSDTWGKLISSTVCPLNDLGAFFDKANLSGSADSSVFFAASGGVRVHCPVMTSPSGASLPTYTSFKNDAELDTFCEKGLSSWSGTTESIVDCSHAMLKDTAGTKDCRAACEKVLAKCDKSAPDLKACYKEALKDPEFAAECEVGLDRNLGGGLVFCKYARVNCEFSPWSDWNTCTHSCRNGEGDSNDSYRVRTRALRGSALNGGVCESDDKSGSSLVDIQLCDWLPLCSGEALPEPDYKIFPRKEPRLAEWTTERTTTTTVDPDAPPPGSEATVCTIIDMRDFKKAERGYDAKHKSCRCPSRTRLCARGEAMNSRENWQTHVETICARDSQADIYAQELEKFSCASREFVAVVGSFSANPEEDCKTDSMAYVFCKDEGPLQNDRTVLQFIVALVIGILLGLTFVYCALQYSVDIQQALGLAGRYVELSHMLQEVEEKENEAQAGSAGDDEKDGEGLPAGRGRGKLLGERGNGEPEEGGNSELTKEGGNSEVLEESGNSELPEDKREWRASTESGSVNE